MRERREGRSNQGALVFASKDHQNRAIDRTERGGTERGRAEGGDGRNGNGAIKNRHIRRRDGRGRAGGRRLDWKGRRRGERGKNMESLSFIGHATFNVTF